MPTLVLEFNPSSTLPLTEGLKHVLFRVTRVYLGDGGVPTEVFQGHEWGFANYVFDTGWEALTEGDITCKVLLWAEAVNPQLLVG